LNALLDAEEDRLCHAQRYERSAARRDTRAGHYERDLQTKAGEVRLRVPKLRRQAFETAIIERYRRRESSVEEALIEMYLAGVSVRRVEDITEALWGHAGEHWRRIRTNNPLERILREIRRRTRVVGAFSDGQSRSTSPPQGCATSPARRGRPRDILTSSC
jgi:transposase-like protein